MARHRIPAQALRNFISILAGFLIGGLNNLVVLPWAFEGHLEDWGLVRLAAAWGTLIGPLLAFSAPAAINRFSPRFRAMEQLSASSVANAAPRSPIPSPASGMNRKLKGMASATIIQLSPIMLR